MVSVQTEIYERKSNYTGHCLVDSVVEEQPWSLSPTQPLYLSFRPAEHMGIRSPLPSISRTAKLRGPNKVPS